MHLTRRHTVEGQDPFSAFRFVKRASRIVNPDGSVVFEMSDLFAPEQWSQVAVDVLAQKYFRKAGLTVGEVKGGEFAPLDKDHLVPTAGHETDSRQVFHRLAGCWRHWGEEYGYFDTTEDAQDRKSTRLNSSH